MCKLTIHESRSQVSVIVLGYEVECLAREALDAAENNEKECIDNFTKQSCQMLPLSEEKLKKVRRFCDISGIL